MHVPLDVVEVVVHFELFALLLIAEGCFLLAAVEVKLIDVYFTLPLLFDSFAIQRVVGLFYPLLVVLFLFLASALAKLPVLFHLLKVLSFQLFLDTFFVRHMRVLELLVGLVDVVLLMRHDIKGVSQASLAEAATTYLIGL